MLVLANSREEASYVAKATVGVVFLGTPHRGSECAKWAQLIAWSGKQLKLDTEDRILKDLQKDSEPLKTIYTSSRCGCFACRYPLFASMNSIRQTMGPKSAA